MHYCSAQRFIQSMRASTKTTLAALVTSRRENHEMNCVRTLEIPISLRPAGHTCISIHLTRVYWLDVYGLEI